MPSSFFFSFSQAITQNCLCTRGDQIARGKVLLNRIAFIDCNENSQTLTIILSRGINVKHFYSGAVQVHDPSGMDLLKLTCKQKENWTVEKVSRMFTVLSFNSNHNL